MQTVARVLCNDIIYGKRSHSGLANANSCRADPPGVEAVEEMEREVIEDLDRAMNVESLRLAKESSEHPLSQSVDGSFSAVSFNDP